MSPDAELINWAETVLWHGFLVFLRVGAIAALLPAFGEQVVPRRIRLALALCFAAIVAPALPAYDPGPPQFEKVVWFGLTEIAVGLALGMVIRFFTYCLQIAGTIAAQSTSLSQLLGTAGVDPTPALGQILVSGGMALAVMTGFHVLVVEYILTSYTLLPPGRFPDGAILAEWGLSKFGELFAFALVLAAPFVLVSALYNLLLGVVNRAMPQLMVAFVGAPLITWGGLALFWLTAPLMLAIWNDALQSFLMMPE